MLRILRTPVERTVKGIRLQSSSTFAVASTHQSAIVGIVGKDHVLSSKDDMDMYTNDWTRNYSGGSLVCFPQNTQEVSEILKYCNTHKIGVVPQGGNTGLVGGGIGTTRGELILSLRRMNKILEIDDKAGVLTCESGCILENLSNEVAKEGFVVPLDLAAKGSCMIGGNVSTNAGGLRVMKYGSLQSNVLGLEVVQADGTVLNMLRTLRKDNCGYHLKHLFIGSEGTLGIITKVSLLLATKPSTSCVVFAKLPGFGQVQSVLSAARRLLGDSLTAFEFMDRNAIATVRRAQPHLLKSIQPGVLPEPLVARATSASSKAESGSGIAGEVCVLIECTGTDADLDQQRVDKFAQYIVEEGLVEDAVLSQSAAQEKELWNIRENLTLSLASLARTSNPLYGTISSSGGAVGISGAPEKDVSDISVAGKLFKYDLSIRLQDTDEALLRLKQRMLKEGFAMKGVDRKTNNPANTLFSACELEFCNYGHIADQNIHLNILAAINTTNNTNTTTITDTTTSTDTSKNGTPFVVTTPTGVAIKAREYTTPRGTVMCVEKDSVKEYIEYVYSMVNKHIFDVVLEVNGSISAEHGIGQQKRRAMPSARTPAELRNMLLLKRALDPNNILNPGKVLTVGDE